MSRRVLGVFLGVATGLLVSVAGWAAPAYYLQADIVRSAAGAPQGPVCVPNSVFTPGEGVVFRVQTYDTATGKALSRPVIENNQVTVQIRLGDGQTLAAHFAPHPPDPAAPATDEYWTVMWLIPDDYPAGTLEWSVVATDAQGQTANFAPIGQSIGIPALLIVPGEAIS